MLRTAHRLLQYLINLYRVAKGTGSIMKGEIIMKINVDKKAVLTGLSAVFGIGAFVVNAMSKNDEINEAAKRAAELLKESTEKGN